MPIRDLLYVAREYEKLFGEVTLYSTKKIKIPTPTFIVFYNGSVWQPERLDMKLSDAFEIPGKNPSLELKVVQLNINHGHNQSLLKKCRTLQEYSMYVERVRQYTQHKPLKEAVEQAVKECIKEGILSRFLTQYKTEAISMSIFEYDEEREMKLMRRAERETGWKEVHTEGIAAFISFCKEIDIAKEEIVSQLISKFNLSRKDAITHLEKTNCDTDC